MLNFCPFRSLFHAFFARLSCFLALLISSRNSRRIFVVAGEVGAVGKEVVDGAVTKGRVEGGGAQVATGSE